MDVAAVFLPLIGCIIAGLFGRTIGDKGAMAVTVTAVCVAAALSVIIFFGVAGGEPRVVELFTWIDSGSFEVAWALQIDTLTAVMHMHQADHHHLQGHMGGGCRLDLREPFEQGLPGAAEHRDRQRGGQGGAAGAFRFRHRGVFRQGWDDPKPAEEMDLLQQILDHDDRVGAAGAQPVQNLERRRPLAAQRGVQQVEDQRAVGQAEHAVDEAGRDAGTVFRQRHGLVEQAQPVAHGAVRRARNQGQRFRLDGEPLGLGDAGEMGNQVGLVDSRQIEALAPGQDRDRNLADLGGGEHEFGHAPAVPRGSSTGH